MTSLRDAAENATAGVPVVPERIWATVNGASTRLPDGVRQFIGGWSEDPSRPRAVEYVKASALDTARAEIESLREALTFYQDGFTFIIDKRRPGLAWVPTETLLDDCGNIARIALADDPAAPSAISPAVKEPK